MASRHSVAGGALRVHPAMLAAVSDIASGTGVSVDAFWSAFAGAVREFAPENARLLKHRDQLQADIDAWHRAHDGAEFSRDAYLAFLKDVGYILPEPAAVRVTTPNVDGELSQVAAPQLVVPCDNARYVVSGHSSMCCMRLVGVVWATCTAHSMSRWPPHRYALNAVNARWGNLLDALYGSNIIPESGGATRRGAGGEAYNPVRGAKVFARAHSILDGMIPLAHGSFADITNVTVHKHGQVRFCLSRKRWVGLQTPEQFVGFRRTEGRVSSVLLKHNNLHVELAFDRSHAIGRTHPAGLFAVVLEAAVTVIADMEDSVAAVDADDKAKVYRNFAGLMRGTLTAAMGKGRRDRRLRGDLQWSRPTGDGTLVLPGRAVVLVRNVGLHMYTDAVVTAAGEEVPEGLLDLFVSALAARHDLLPSSAGAGAGAGTGAGAPARLSNSRTGSAYVAPGCPLAFTRPQPLTPCCVAFLFRSLLCWVCGGTMRRLRYIVKPKMHGPEEVGFTVRTLKAAELAVGLPQGSLKLGIMDEERRTTVNLKRCIAAASDRVVFINTGFLDRTGDEIHTSMAAGAVLAKSDLARAPWRVAYEAWNVDVGLETGLEGFGQIGKGMWAEPDNLARMLETKISHPKAGASCAWVPSPTAATLHAIHYHEADVAAIQAEFSRSRRRNVAAALRTILDPPLVRGGQRVPVTTINEELANCAQGILG